MADITDVTLPYEILWRFGLDGSVQGVHQQRRRIVRDGYVVLAEQLLPAEGLDPGSFPASEACGEALAVAGRALEQLKAQISELQASLAAETERADYNMNVGLQMQARIAEIETRRTVANGSEGVPV